MTNNRSEDSGWLTPQQVEQFKDDGLLIIRDILPPEAMQPLIDELMQKVDVAVDGAVKSGVLDQNFEDAPFPTRLALAERACSDHVRLLDNYFRDQKPRSHGIFVLRSFSVLLNIVESLIGPEILAHPQFNIRAKMPGQQSTVIPWHQDLAYLVPEEAGETLVVNLWIPLVRAYTEHGCMQLLRGSHRLGLLPHDYQDQTPGHTGSKGIAVTDLPDCEIVTAELDVGDDIYLGSNTTTSKITAIANNTRLTVQTTLPTNTPGANIYNESEISVGMDPGKAYVKGYEYESIDTHYLDVDKGRDTETVTSFATSAEVGNYLIVDTANGMFDVAASEVVQLHSVKRGSINVTNNTVYAATQVGTARVRSMDFDTVSGNTGNPDTNHSNYRLYLWDVNTSNNITGTAAAAQSNTQIVQLETASTSYVNDAYTGASITVNTKAGVDDTSDVRIINDYYSNSTGHFVVCNTVLSQASHATTNATHTATTYEIDFKIKDVESVVVSSLGAPPAITTSADVSDPGKYNNSSSANTILGATDTVSYTHLTLPTNREV